MVNTKEYSIAAAEVIDIIQHMDEELIEKIPLNVIKNLNKMKEPTYISNIDYTDIDVRELKPETQCLLTSIYMDYLCTEEERNRINNLIRKNSMTLEAEKQERYSTEDLFNKNKTEIPNTKAEISDMSEETRVQSGFEMVIVKPKRNFFQRLLDKFRRN